MARPTTLILRTAGTNCDRELAHAFELAGARTETVHLHALIDEPRRLDEVDLIGLPGGFSYGDDIAAGRIFANRLRHRLLEPLLQVLDRGAGVIGICNGFQVLVQLGLLPDPRPGRQVATLAENTAGRFIDRWTRLEADPASNCLWTRGLGQLELPIAHGQGRFTAVDRSVLDRLRAQGQIPLRYAADDNPNGSADDIAGVCDPTGRVLGLMPHPERCVHPRQHPSWTRWDDQAMQTTPPGLRMIRNAVEHAKPGERPQVAG